VFNIAVVPETRILPAGTLHLNLFVVPFGAEADAVIVELSPRLMTEGFAAQLRVGGAEADCEFTALHEGIPLTKISSAATENRYENEKK
jgi:hypothetical protein